MYSFQFLLFLSVFLVIEAETSPLKREEDGTISSIDDFGEYLEKALTFTYKPECLFRSCNNLENTPFNCATIGEVRAIAMNAFAPVLIKCAEEGACDANIFAQSFKQTNIPLPGKNDKSKCYLTSNPGKLLLSNIKLNSKYLADLKSFGLDIAGKLTFTGFKFTCPPEGEIPFEFEIDFDMPNEYVYDRLNPGKPLTFHTVVQKKYSDLVYKAFEVFYKNEHLSKHIDDAIGKLLPSLYNSFSEKKCP